MKNLPDKFPIRYALIIPNDDDYNEEEPFLLEVLFNEYLSLLKNRPLDYLLLFPDYISLDFTILDKRVFQIPKLYADKEWMDMAEQKIKEVLPEAFLSGWTAGRAFLMGLYSYKKSAEIPAFVRLKNINNTNAKHYYKIYERVRMGELDEWDLYRLLGNRNRAIRQDLYYSNVWKKLDKDKEIGGFIFHINKHKEGRWFQDLPEETNNMTKISVLICKSWEDLFAEEIFALYKMFNYCNNCGKALPFNYSGKYCPNELENVDCIRERARKRKHSQDKN